MLGYPWVGIRIRAGIRDLETTSALGVNIYRLRALNFGCGCLFAGLSGVLAAGVLGLTPPMGNSLIMPSFVAIIVGGVGSLEEILFGPGRFADGTTNIVGALRRAMATTGYSDLKEFQRVEVVGAPYERA